MLLFCLDSIPTDTWQQPGMLCHTVNWQQPHRPGPLYKGLRDPLLPLLHSCSITLLLLLPFSCLLPTCSPSLPIAFPPTHYNLGHGQPLLHIYSILISAFIWLLLSPSLCFSLTTTLLIPLHMPWINSILCYTTLELVSKGEWISWHVPAEVPLSCIPL